MTEVRNNVEENKSPADRHVALVCDMNTVLTENKCVSL